MRGKKMELIIRKDGERTMNDALSAGRDGELYHSRGRHSQETPRAGYGITFKRVCRLCLILFCICLTIAEGAGALQVQEPRTGERNIRQDSELAEKVKRALAANQSLRDRIITVIVNDGIALLSGTVDSNAERAEAVLTTFRVQGVIDVVDRMSVSQICQ